MEGVAGSTRPSIPVPLLWEMEMPLLSGTYLQQECARAEQDRDIHCTTGGRIDLEPSAFEELSLLDQEEALVEDLICALRGFEGTFIKTRSRREGDTVEFYVSGPNAGELKNSVTMLVQLCTDRSQLETFRCTARSYDQGLIRHALGEELFQVLTVHLCLICLKHRRLLHINAWSMKSLAVDKPCSCPADLSSNQHYESGDPLFEGKNGGGLLWSD